MLDPPVTTATMSVSVEEATLGGPEARAVLPMNGSCHPSVHER